MLDKKVFAANLKRLMEEKGIDRFGLCAATGFKYSTVSAWLNPKEPRYPRLPTINKLADYFGVPTEALTSPYLPPPDWSKFVPDPRIPIFDSIKAGIPVANIGDWDGEVIPCPEYCRDASFACRVSGDSMEGVGLFEGDIAFIRECPDFSDGQIVAVMFRDESGDFCGLIKKIYRTPDGGVRLHSCNDRYHDRLFSPRQLAACEFRVCGCLVGSLRDFDKGYLKKNLW